MMEKAKANDVTASGLIARPASSEGARAMGKFTFECYDKDGKLKWTAESKNLVVNVGLQYMAGTALDGATARITSWYIGLYGAGASNTPAASDTLASHAGWTEITPYSGSRPAATFAAATTANPSVVTNSASKASYSITSSATVGGAFLASAASGTSGTLFSASDFTGGDRSVVNGDTLQVTYTFSLSA
jgi:hypothetical protein